MNEKIISFLKSHPLIKLDGLEKKCAIPQSTLSKALDGNSGRGLPDKYLEALEIELKNYGFKK